MNLQEQLFIQYASKGLDKSLAEMVKTHLKKKGRRFNTGGITYEISAPSSKDGGISFEISSKIPEEKFSGNTDLDAYFVLIKKKLIKDKIDPSSIDMENITGTDKNVEKSRDYVKVNCFYKIEDLYSDKDIERQISAGKNSLSDIPEIPGVYTVAGRLVLLSIQKNIYENCNANINILIKANAKAIKELKLK